MFINQTKAMSKILGFIDLDVLYKPSFHSAPFTTELCVECMEEL